ncbi:MAG TPA: hypothetical protein VGS28_00730 [Candidatus Saccharimonadales bacterium]|nr:hypothetical protein [Candidatus Saccharimonadales bacterium]
MTFEVFKAIGTRSRAFISVTENKSFGLPRAFIDKYGITKDHKAVILYDKGVNKVGLHFSANAPKFGLAVRIPNEKHGGLIVARSFFDVNSLDAAKYAGRYADFEVVKLSEIGINKEGDGDAFVITLKEKVVPTEEPGDNDPDTVDADDFIDLSKIPF